jgi:hypothetical protein
MRRHLGVLAILLLVPASASSHTAALVPEQLLDGNSVAYFRFDGLDPHRQAYEKTALAEVLRGDLGNLFAYVGTVFKDTIGPTIAKEQVLSGRPAKNLKEIRRAFDQLPLALAYLGRQGVVVGIEVIDVKKPRVQVTVIFPNAGDDPQGASIPSLFRLTAALAEVKIQESKMAGRTIFQLDTKETAPSRVAWWQEGKHWVLTLGTEGPAHTLDLVQKKRSSLADNPLYQSLLAFKKYETVARGYVDLERVVKLARSVDPMATGVIEDLGLGNLKTLTMQFGFEGREERSTVVLSMPGQRRGLLRPVVNRGAVAVDHLPALPPDTNSVAVFNMDWGAMYDLLVPTGEAVAGRLAPDAKPKIQEGIKALNQALGVDLRHDLLDQLGPLFVVYNSPGEGAVSLGFGFAFQVRDAKKLDQTLNTLFKSLPGLVGTDVSLKKETYHGAELNTVKVGEKGIFVVPSYTLHQGWMVIGLFPQTVEGYILRSGGKYAVWKPTPLAGEVLAGLQKESPQARILSLTISDPRPALKQLLPLAR